MDGILSQAWTIFLVALVVLVILIIIGVNLRNQRDKKADDELRVKGVDEATIRSLQLQREQLRLQAMQAANQTRTSSGCSMVVAVAAGIILAVILMSFF